MMQRWSRKKTHFPLLVILLLIFIVFTVLYNELSIQQIHEEPDPVHHRQETSITYVKPNRLSPAHEVLDRFSKCNATRDYSGRRIASLDRTVKTGPRRVASERCDVFSGKWVFDNASYPLYNESHCPYMSDQLACHKHGRPDLGYQYWRWQPHNCNLNRLDERIIRPDSVLKHASQWEHADILVFNTYLWWRQGPVKLLWSAEENGTCEELDGKGAMELAMKAWADWVAAKVDPLKKRVFFATMSPTHLWSREWEPGSEGNCYNEKTPMELESYWGSGSDLPTMRMVDDVLGRLSSKVSVLNITQLSEYRKDGHPSIYRKFWETLRPEQLSNPASYSDCIHWCLPGVPDVWNELLFHLL
ncbi:protein trichome birefringence-like 35 isoform X2 [Carya illinoinensis]|uniref:protein trichome birefringence-like 35 isoform X2 n=1 Tax=Carya illinoinensis TaxID=32201 RepID=UPI001C7223EB|nr:protein trichome birefringence-like 35 isoform X2 [Carya illinoinensis]